MQLPFEVIVICHHQTVDFFSGKLLYTKNFFLSVKQVLEKELKNTNNEKDVESAKLHTTYYAAWEYFPILQKKKSITYFVWSLRGPVRKEEAAPYLQVC